MYYSGGFTATIDYQATGCRVIRTKVSTSQNSVLLMVSKGMNFFIIFKYILGKLKHGYTVIHTLITRVSISQRDGVTFILPAIHIWNICIHLYLK